MNAGEKFLKEALDKGIAHIRGLNIGEPKIEIKFEGEVDGTYTPDQTAEAAKYASEVDGVLSYVVFADAWTKEQRRAHGQHYVVLHDGPYDSDNAAEIVMDCNDAAGKILGY